MTNPIVSVIMPVYNGEGYIAKAIESVLNQTLRDFELIIITEFGSSIASINEVEKFSDRRIVHIKNKQKLGLIESLNLGIRIAKGGYIARMDSDDISLPTRLEKQVTYLDANPDVGVLGTLVWYIDRDGKRTYKPRYYTEPGSLAWDMFFNSPIPHPTAMIRSELVTLLGGYDPAARLVEDYDLWMRAARTSRLANLSEELVLIRKHGENITIMRRDEQNLAASKLAADEMERLLGRSVPVEEVERLRQPDSLSDGGEALRAARLLNELFTGFLSSRNLTAKERNDIKRYFARIYSVLISIGLKRGWGVTSELLNSSSEAGVSKVPVLAQSLIRWIIR